MEVSNGMTITLSETHILHRSPQGWGRLCAIFMHIHIINPGENNFFIQVGRAGNYFDVRYIYIQGDIILLHPQSFSEIEQIKVKSHCVEPRGFKIGGSMRIWILTPGKYTVCASQIGRYIFTCTPSPLLFLDYFFSLNSSYISSNTVYKVSLV